MIAPQEQFTAQQASLTHTLWTPHSLNSFLLKNGEKPIPAPDLTPRTETLKGHFVRKNKDGDYQIVNTDEQSYDYINTTRLTGDGFYRKVISTSKAESRKAGSNKVRVIVGRETEVMSQKKALTLARALVDNATNYNDADFPVVDNPTDAIPPIVVVYGALVNSDDYTVTSKVLTDAGMDVNKANYILRKLEQDGKLANIGRRSFWKLYTATIPREQLEKMMGYP